MVSFIEQTYFEVSNTPDVPTKAEIDFLHPPVLQKHNAPGNRDDGIEIRAATPKGPSKDTSCGWKNQGDHVGLQETEIKPNLSDSQHSANRERMFHSNLLSVYRPDAVEVIHIQDKLAAELIQHLVVHFLVVQREDRRHILAMIVARHKFSPSQLLGPGDKVIHGPQAFSLGFCFGNCVIGALWPVIYDSIQPVLHPRVLLVVLVEMTVRELPTVICGRNCQVRP